MASGFGTMRDLLKQVSRSFYLTLRILPHSVNRQLSIAYLLARAADTIADTHLINIQKRREALSEIRKSIQFACEGRMPPVLNFGELAQARRGIAGQGTSAERILLEKIGPVLNSLANFAVEDRRSIRDLLLTITRGQEMDLVRFSTASAAQIVALDTESELEDYTYCVAGCVGEFWTKMCGTHVFMIQPQNNEIFLAKGVRFGKGLQLVNILRDLPVDLRQGRCYIPKEQLLSYGLQPRELLETEAIGRFRPLYCAYLQRAEEYLAAGWEYIMMIPFRCMRVRLACAWAILIGMRTLELLHIGNVLDNGRRIKLSRSEIRRLIIQSVLLYPFPKTWSRLFARNSDAK